MKQWMLLWMLAAFVVCAGGCGTERGDSGSVHGSQIVCATSEYEEINPLTDEYGGATRLLFDGLMRYDGTGAVVPGLAASYEYDPETYTYVFHLRDGVVWHDGKPLCAADVKFTIEAVQDPLVRASNKLNFEDVREVTEIDERTVRIRLSAPNAAFLDHMLQPILPAHLLAGRDLMATGFFHSPVGTGPFQMESWEAGRRLTLVRNENYYRGAPKIEHFVFKFLPDEETEVGILEKGGLNLANLSPKNAALFANRDGFRRYAMKSADYAAILVNRTHPYWQKNSDLLPAIAYAIDRQKVIDEALMGTGMPAYGPLQRNVYNNPDIPHYDYDPAKARELLVSAGCTMGSDGYYMRDGEEVGFVLTLRNDQYSRLDIANAVAAQLCEVGIHCTVETPAKVDRDGQMAYLSRAGSALDADVHTYKTFRTDGSANDGHYSNPRVDAYLLAARRTLDPAERRRLYGLFQEEVARDLPYVFICYIDRNIVTSTRVHGITEDLVLGHRGAGMFWNVHEWTVD